MMCQYGFINYNTCTNSREMSTMGEAMHMWGRESMRNLYTFPSILCGNFTFSMKVISFKKIKGLRKTYIE